MYRHCCEIHRTSSDYITEVCFYMNFYVSITTNLAIIVISENFISILLLENNLHKEFNVTFYTLQTMYTIKQRMYLFIFSH